MNKLLPLSAVVSVVAGVWLAVLIAVAIGLARSEGPLPDTNALNLVERGIQKANIRIVQATPIDKLRLEIDPYERLLPGDYRVPGQPALQLAPDQWRRVQQMVERFVAAENQTQAQVFGYEETADGRVIASTFDAKLFEYRNPFDESAAGPIDRPAIDGTNAGTVAGTWRVSGARSLFIIDPSAPRDEAIVDFDSGASVGCIAAKRVIFKSHQTRVRLTATAAPAVVRGQQRSNLEIASVNGAGTVVGQPQRFTSGEYFTFSSAPFVVSERGDSDTVPSLMFSKLVNGRPTRVHVDGRATSNLLGVQTGGYGDGLDGAIKTRDVTRVRLTIDPELQFCASTLLETELNAINGLYPMERRRASATVLDANSGAILAQVGAPSRTLREVGERRRIRIMPDASFRDPTTEIHMAGSTVKVLTVGLGYLLAGSALPQLLPPSNNSLAIEQAFRDAYGVALGVPPLGQNKRVTAAAAHRFAEAGNPERVTPQFARVVQEVFRVLPLKEGSQSPRRGDASDLRESIVPQNLRLFFDERQLAANTYPDTSRLPMWDADSIGVFKNYALGEQDSRFTTLRIASILSTVSTGKVFEPHLVASVTDRKGTVHAAAIHAPTDISVPWADDGPRRIQAMQSEMPEFLHRVLVPKGTGFFYYERAGGGPGSLFLGQDDPTTPWTDESVTRAGDFGKSGTADYGETERLQDSLFVYRHGRYVVAAWLEKADIGPQVEEHEKVAARHPAHHLVHNVVQVLEGTRRQ